MVGVVSIRAILLLYSTAVATAVRVAIDLSFGQRMCTTEHKSLARQLVRCYGANKKRPSPLELHLTSMSVATQEYPDCLPPENHYKKWNRDFINLLDPPAQDVWGSDELVWLSPDADVPLEAPLSPKSVYVLGGLIDRSVDKNQTLLRAEACGAVARRFPIREYASHANLNTILALPACIEILADVHSGASWEAALAAALPVRRIRQSQKAQAKLESHPEFGHLHRAGRIRREAAREAASD